MTIAGVSATTREQTLAAALTGGSLGVLESSADRVERFLLDRFPESCRVERTIASFADVTG